MGSAMQASGQDSARQGNPVPGVELDDSQLVSTDQAVPERPRRARRLSSGDAIREAAAALLLEQGYQGTSMDDIAAAAHISKQTIYTHFNNKESLFEDLVLGNVDRVEDFVSGMARTVDEAASMEEGLHALAQQYLRILTRPDVLRLRRLVIGEAGRFPELARTYYQRVPERVYTALAALMKDLADTGRLHLNDPVLAANHFAWLVIGTSMDRAMFHGADTVPSNEEIDRLAQEATRVFVAAYGRHPASSNDRGT